LTIVNGADMETIVASGSDASGSDASGRDAPRRDAPGK